MKRKHVLMLSLACSVFISGISTAKTGPPGKLIMTLGRGNQGSWVFEPPTHTSSAAVCDPAQHTGSISSIRCWGNWIELSLESPFNFSLKNTITNKRHPENKCVITIAVQCDYDEYCVGTSEKIEDRSQDPDFSCKIQMKPMLMLDTGDREVHYQIGY